MLTFFFQLPLHEWSAAIGQRVLTSTSITEDETAITAPTQEHSEEAQSVRVIVQQEI